jgi:hypothetical protein
MPSNPFKLADPVKAIIRVRRGPESDRVTEIYEDGELVWSTDKKRLFVGDNINVGGILAGNKIWFVDSFQKLPNIQINDCVFRTDTNAFYILTGERYLMEDNYALVGGRKLITSNVAPAGTYTLPDATQTVKGGVLVGDGLKAVNGVLSINYDTASLSIDPATNKLKAITGGSTSTPTRADYTNVGVVRVVADSGIKIFDGALSLLIDNRTIKLSSNPLLGTVLYAENTGTTGTSFKMVNQNITLTTNTLYVTAGGLLLNNEGSLFLDKATPSQIGGIKPLSGLYVDTEGNLSVNYDNDTIVLDEDTQQLKVNTYALSSAPSLSASLSAIGWQKFPSGLIMQWGQAMIAAATTITFAIPFNTAVYQVVMSEDREQTGSTPWITAKTVNGFSTNGGVIGTIISYTAIGV